VPFREGVLAFASEKSATHAAHAVVQPQNKQIWSVLTHDGSDYPSLSRSGDVYVLVSNNQTVGVVPRVDVYEHGTGRLLRSYRFDNGTHAESMMLMDDGETSHP
jgi:hypothetical protein